MVDGGNDSRKPVDDSGTNIPPRMFLCLKVATQPSRHGKEPHGAKYKYNSTYFKKESSRQCSPFSAHFRVPCLRAVF